MLRNLLGVQKLSKPNRKLDNSIFAEVEVSFNQGIVRYVGQDLSSKFAEGDRVFFGNQRTEIRMFGEDIMVMDEANVYAKILSPESEG